jgi:hypothetical protein
MHEPQLASVGGARWSSEELWPSSSRMAWVLFVAFWVWYAASGVVFLRGPGGFDSIWPLSLSLIWWLVLLFRAELQAWGRAVPLPIWLKFLIVGLFFSDVVMGNLAVSFKGDLHPKGISIQRGSPSESGSEQLLMAGRLWRRRSGLVAASPSLSVHTLAGLFHLRV